MIILSGDDPQIKEVLSQRAEELDEHKEEMTMISALLNRLSLRRNNWAYQFSAEKWEHDWTSRWHTGIDNARKEGIAIGEVQGRVEGEFIGEHNAKLATARLMLANNLPVSDIAKYTGLPESEILALRK